MQNGRQTYHTNLNRKKVKTPILGSNAKHQKDWRRLVNREGTWKSVNEMNYERHKMCERQWKQNNETPDHILVHMLRKILAIKRYTGRRRMVESPACGYRNSCRE